MFRVIESFTDLQDGNYPYRIGDVFPRDGFNASSARIAELANGSNRRGIPLIEEVQDEPAVSIFETVEQPAEDVPRKRGRKSTK